MTRAVIGRSSWLSQRAWAVLEARDVLPQPRRLVVLDAAVLQPQSTAVGASPSQDGSAGQSVWGGVHVEVSVGDQVPLCRIGDVSACRICDRQVHLNFATVAASHLFSVW